MLFVIIISFMIFNVSIFTNVRFEICKYSTLHISMFQHRLLDRRAVEVGLLVERMQLPGPPAVLPLMQAVTLAVSFLNHIRDIRHVFVYV